MNFTTILAKELPTLQERIARERAIVCQADWVFVTIVCCDSRQVLPTTLIETRIRLAQNEVKKQNVFFVSLPTIGSGAPSRSRLREVVAELVAWGVAPQKIKLLVTQHGDAEELAAIGTTNQAHVSCGLRKLFAQNREFLSEVGRALRLLAADVKARTKNKFWAPDRVEMEELRAMCEQSSNPRINTLFSKIDAFFAETHDGAHLPTRLIIRSAYRNSDPSLMGNLDSVQIKLGGTALFTEGLDVLLDGVSEMSIVDGAAYDHNAKLLLPVNKGLLVDACPLGLPARTGSHQDPQYVSVTFGKHAIPYSVRTLFPSLFGDGDGTPIDNAFRTVASIASVPTLLCAISEAMYAVLHKVQPHEGDLNFRSLERLVIICDDSRYVRVVEHMLTHPEFVSEYLPLLRKLQPEGIDVVNLDMGADGELGVPQHRLLKFQ